MKAKLSERDEKRVNKKFDSFKDKEYSEDDIQKVFDNEQKIMRKMDSSSLREFIDDVKLFFCMLKDFFTKEYTDVPSGTIMAIVGSLLYVFLPIDLIPDFIPGIGYVDDAGVVGLCVKWVKDDLKKYKEFKGL